MPAIQVDIFVTPRSSEEFYDIANDPFQLYNLAVDSVYQKIGQKSTKCCLSGGRKQEITLQKTSPRVGMNR
ncbi:hypothetical protein [Echinicola arenosa]|uniref:hypothetical protein n=1 Tax=Echinicola arenosa TaxID=2774144 RepID=UPI0017805471|nr:hypothetical protein [Echinicola arenosa]